jgi:hypothetical protein
MIGSYYIGKDKQTRRTFNESPTKRKSNQQASGEINLGEYSHQNVDRFAILLDLWTNEVNFLEMKKNVR